MNRPLSETLARFSETGVAQAISSLVPCDSVPPAMRIRQYKDLHAYGFDLAVEMIAPTLTLLRAASPRPADIAQHLVNYDFDDICDRWLRAVEQRLKYLQEAHNHIAGFCADRKLRLVSVTPLNGDSHNGGKSPLLLSVNCGEREEKYVYKPVNAQSTKIVNVVADFITTALGIAQLAPSIEVEGKNWHIRSFVERGKNRSEEEIKKYFYSYGALVSVANFLELTDLHFENVVSGQDSPVVIDSEFVMTSSNGIGGKWSYHNCGLFDKTTSPVSQKTHHTYIESVITSDERVVYGAEKSSEDHVIRGENGNLVRPGMYLPQVNDGLAAADRIFRLRKDEIEHNLLNTIDDIHKLRFWPRSTAYYKTLQMNLWLPKTPRFEDRVNCLKTKLSRRSSFTPSIKRVIGRVIDAEISDLSRTDIPYFWIDGESGDLMHLTGIVQHGFCRPTIAAIRALSQKHWRDSRVRIRSLVL